MKVDPRNEMEVLTADECLELLGDQDLGRLAVTVGAQPDIFPINYVLNGNKLIFRTAPGSKLASVVINSRVAFEADSYSADSGIAWSVIVHGEAQVVADESDELKLERLPLFPWNTAPKSHFVFVEIDSISGRRFHASGKR